MRLSCIFLLVTLCCCCCLANDRRHDGWIEVKTPHFSIYSDASPKRALELGAQFECARQLFSTETDEHTEDSKPVEVIAFRNWSEMAEVAPFWGGQPVKISGYHQQGERVTFIALDLSAPNIEHIVAHEFSHAARTSNGAQLPVWLQEGLAESFADAFVAHMPTEPLARERIPLVSLLSVQTTSPEYNEARFHRTFYAQASLAADYFRKFADRAQFARYLELISGGASIDAAIQEAFQMSGVELDAAIQAFAQNRQGASHISARTGCVQVESVVRPISSADIGAHIAELKSLTDDHRKEAIGEFSKLLQTHPEHEIALRGLAYALWQSGDLQRSAEYFKRAAQVAPGDAKLLLYSAVLGAPVAQRSPESRQEMKQALHQAILLDDNSADAHHWLSIVDASDGDYTAASLEGLRAVELDPGNEEFKFNLASFYAHSHQTAEARRIGEQLRSAHSKSVAANTELLLKHLEGDALISETGLH